MEISVNGFEHGGSIPRKFTCDGADISPRITWKGIPDGARSLALIMDDPDAPSGAFTHWIVYNIPPGEQELKENFPKTGKTAGKISQGKNDFGNVGYGGPCPPRGNPHRYFFRLYALGSEEVLEPRISVDRLESSIKGKSLAEAEYMGTYKRD